MKKPELRHVLVILFLVVFVILFYMEMHPAPKAATEMPQNLVEIENKYPKTEIDYYAYADNLDLIEIIDSPNLTMEMLESRNGKLIIEKAVGVVTNAETGEGYIIGWPEFYISYASTPGEISNGDVICSYFIYNPDSNYCDDILLRFDYIIERK